MEKVRRRSTSPKWDKEEERISTTIQDLKQR
jgi:hypothetical protein